MKKSFILFPTLLLVIFVIFSAIDRGDYVVEKKMWKIQEQFAQQAKYGTLSKEGADNLLAMYQDLVRQYPESGLLARIYMKIAQIYVLNKDYEKARTNYKEALRQIPQQKDLRAEALFLTGLTYETQNNDALALETYQKTVKEYPLTDIGLNMPLYIVGYYRRLNENARMENEFKEAENFYLKIDQENPGSLEGLKSLRLLTATYLVEKKWNIAVKIFEKILLDYNQSPYLDWKTAGTMVYSINAICVKKLMEPDQAISFYQMFIEQHPAHPLNKFLGQVIASLQGLKSSNKAFVIQKI